MNLPERLGLPLLRRIDPEIAHDMALRALRAGLTPTPGPVTSPRLATSVAGLSLPNPIGLAAGLDKNATAVAPLMRMGFGFIETGAATPNPQAGNPRPRLFRLTEDRALINRMGFNNDGMEVITERLAERPNGVPVGLNLGANANSDDRAADFVTVLRRCGPHVDFATVNVSSPNTDRLRDLQYREALSRLLAGVMEARESLRRPIPIFLKISPDLTDKSISELAEVAVTRGIHAIVATNTTVGRDGLTSRYRTEAGGLSGAPLFRRSTYVLARLRQLVGDGVPLVGVGGVASAGDAYAKILTGASAVQLYTAVTFEGFSVSARIARELDGLLSRDGFANVADAVGAGARGTT
ncbi:MAG: quinone-dependent dihydroorotate dehydrogenase [Rhodobacter sp.]|nr:quinone-dependent dihydroorotate dehydrogenase [Rhodobacter sp.]MCY4167055.1 quinone-dependent dihydroorotate dehydrogenase [Rhodobacter sp.]MCY4242944.1 quinone-dependent dihydroorotate dehydrogenase [Rhodobacter sp.]